MTQRTWAGLLALALTIVVWGSAVGERLPFITESPGVTVNVLGEHNGKPVIQVSGHKVYRDDGQLRLTTVYVTLPDTKVNLFGVMWSYVDPDAAVIPYSSVYAPQTTNASDQQQGAQQMTSSQDAAIAAAMHELGYAVPTVPAVSSVQPGTPAQGVLKPGDRILAIDGVRMHSLEGLKRAVQKTPKGQALSIRIDRGGTARTVSATPTVQKGRKIIGVEISLAIVRFPFDVNLNINREIGGPSAGLMFSLGIYDTLTPGSLTGGETIAGTGTMDLNGTVGPIGGIEQKIAASREAEAKIFLVPADNCADIVDARPGDMRLVKVTQLSDAIASVKAWDADHAASLPTCSTDVKAGADG